MRLFRYCTILIFVFILSIAACSRNKHAIVNEESGMFSQTLKIRSLPTKATIFINEREIGTTPLKYKLSHESSRMINIKAVPIYPNQYTQNIFVMIPPIPKTMTIYMNHFPEDYDRNKDSEFIPPQKPAPQVIVQTETDTVYVDRETKEYMTLKLPVIFFDTDKFDIRSSELDKLLELEDLLEKNPDLQLDIYGFADHRASEEHNLTLTLNRANSVKSFLINRGISANRMEAYGHGKVSKVSSQGIDMDLQESRKVLFLLRRP